LNKVLNDNVFSLNDGNIFLKRNYLLKGGDRYSLNSFYAFNFYVKLGLLSLFKKFKRKKRRSYFFFGKKRRRFYPQKGSIKKRIFFYSRVFHQRSLKKRIFNFVGSNLFFVNFYLLKKRRFLFFKTFKRFSLKKNYFRFMRFMFMRLRSRKKVPLFLRTFLKRAFYKNILKFRRFLLYKFFFFRRQRKRKTRRFLLSRFSLRPWSLFMSWRNGYLLPEPFLQLIYFLDSPSNPKDMLFSFNFNIRNLLFVYQAIK